MGPSSPGITSPEPSASPSEAFGDMPENQKESLTNTEQKDSDETKSKEGDSKGASPVEGGTGNE